MAMYYYASKLNEASCSGCNVKLPPPPAEPAPSPPEHSSLPTDPALLHGTGLSYYDNDSYYSLVRGNNFKSENNCKHMVMNGGINFVTSQSVDPPQLTAVLAPNVKSAGAYDKPDLEYKDGHIVTATFDALVEVLRPGASKPYVFTFLLCSRLFVKPHELLAKLCKRYFKNYEKVGKTEMKELMDREVTDMISLVRVLSQWTSMFPYDFRDERVMALVRNITQRCSIKHYVSLGRKYDSYLACIAALRLRLGPQTTPSCAADHMSPIRADVSSMLEKLLDKLTALEQYEESLVVVPQVSHVDQLPLGDILTLGLTPVELANQLTNVELHRLSFVGPEEFVQTFAPPQAPQATSAKNINIHHAETKSTKNLEAYAEWFNQLSYLVATDILKAVKSKYRARVMEQWVMTARECFNLGNFNSLMAIVGALNMAPIARLKKTWNRTNAVCGQQLRQLELCVEPSSNHARYRAALAAAPTETAVPLLSVTCRDLHFVNQATPTKLAGNRVNFEKCTMLARNVSAQLASRRLMSDGPAVAPPTPHLHLPAWRFLSNRPALTDQAMELTSFEREPPVDHHEKERLKRLRGPNTTL